MLFSINETPLPFTVCARITLGFPLPALSIARPHAARRARTSWPSTLSAFQPKSFHFCYLTGGKHTAWETFEKWAETVPYTMRNPLYHWTHLELSRVFGIDKLLCPATAREIFEECNAKLATPEFRGQVSDILISMTKIMILL